MQSGSAQSYNRTWTELRLEYEQEQRRSLPNQAPASDPLLHRIKETLAENGIGSIDVNILLLIKINFTSSSSNEPLKIARAFRAVETYALNLFHRFWKREYYRLKRYGGYFKTYVDAYLKGIDIVFHQMGYTLSDDETEWQMVGPTEKEWATELAPICINIAFYCCVAAIECEYVASVCSELGQRNTPGYVFLHRLDNPATPRITIQQLRQKTRSGTAAATAILNNAAEGVPASALSKRTQLPLPSSAPAASASFPQAEARKQKLEPAHSPKSSGSNIASNYGNNNQKDYYDVPSVAGCTASAPADSVGNFLFPDSGCHSGVFGRISSPTRSSLDITAQPPFYRLAASGISGSAAAAAAERIDSSSNRTSESGRHDPIEMSEPLAPAQSLYSGGYYPDVTRPQNSTFDATRTRQDSLNRASWETEAATADEHFAMSLHLLDERSDISPFPPPPTAFSSSSLDASDGLAKLRRVTSNDPRGSSSNDPRRFGTSDLGPASRSPRSVTTRVGEPMRPDASDLSMADFSIREPPPYSDTTNVVGVRRLPVSARPTSSADARAHVSSAAAASGISESNANRAVLFPPRSTVVTALQSETGNDGLYVYNRIGP